MHDDQHNETPSQLEREIEALLPTRSELRAEYSDLIDDLRHTILSEFRKPLSAKVFELSSRMRLRLAEGMELIENALSSMTPQAIAATRGISPSASGQTPDAGSPGFTFLKPGENGHGRLTIKPLENGQVNLELALLGADYQPISHFFVTATDQNNNRLLDRKEIREGQCIVPSVPLDFYWIWLESSQGTTRVQLGIGPETDPSDRASPAT